MLPGFVAGHYGANEAQVPVAPLAEWARCEVVIGEVVSFDAAQRVLTLQDGRPIAGTIISINCGAVTSLGNSTPAEDALPAKPMDDFALRWEQLVNRIEADPGIRIAVVGAGAGGVELALALRYRMQEAARRGARPDQGQVTLFDRQGLLQEFSPAVRRSAARRLERGDVLLITDDDLPALPEANRNSTLYDEQIWATGVRPAEWLVHSGLALDAKGFVAVDEHLRSTSHGYVFCAGDAAGLIGSPCPKAGVIAVRQGPVLARNLHAQAQSLPLIRFTPPRIWLSILSTGERYAIASRGSWSVEGHWVWHWKDWIDRRFIAKYKCRSE
ncbi:selenide,water dikinase [Rhodoligotrophos appendicifer]